MPSTKIPQIPHDMAGAPNKLGEQMGAMLRHWFSSSISLPDAARDIELEAAARRKGNTV